MSEIEEEAHISVSEQIEKTSVNMITFSALNENTGMPTNIPSILGGEAIITDEVAKLKVEEAFGQLNIQNLFGVTDEVLESCLYDTFHVETEESNGEEKKLTPHVYLLKSHTNSVYLLNLLTTPYADLNLDSYFREVEFMSRSFSGVFRRTNAQVESEIIDDEKQDAICRETTSNLAGYMHYTIFTERGLREKTGDVQKASMMILGMFLELDIVSTEYQCMGDCGKTYAQDDILLEGKVPMKDPCPECGGKIVYAPPIIKIDKVQYIFPEGASKFLGTENPMNASPTRFLGMFTGIAMPRNIALTTNRLSPMHFSTLATIPSKASFSYPNQPQNRVTINTNWRRIDNRRVFAFVSIGSTEFSDDPHIPFIPQLSFIAVNTKVVEGFKKNKTLAEILRTTVINDWVLTDPLKIKDLGQYNTLDDLPKGGTQA